MFEFLFNLIKLMFAGRGACWLFGNVRAADAITALVLPFVVGLIFGAAVAAVIAEKKAR